MKFKEWLKIKENATSTAAIAVFARPVFSEPVRRASVEDLHIGKKRKKKKKH